MACSCSSRAESSANAPTDESLATATVPLAEYGNAKNFLLARSGLASALGARNEIPL